MPRMLESFALTTVSFTSEIWLHILKMLNLIMPVVDETGDWYTQPEAHVCSLFMDIGALVLSSIKDSKHINLKLSLILT